MNNPMEQTKQTEAVAGELMTGDGSNNEQQAQQLRPLTAVERKALELAALADSCVVDSASDYQRWSETLLNLQDSRKEIEQLHAASIEAAHKAHKTAIAARNALCTPIQSAEQKINAKLSDWQAAERRAAEERERQLLAEAQKQREEEIERELELAEQTGATGDELRQIMEEEQARPLPMPTTRTAAAAVPKVSGLAAKSKLVATVHDLHAFVRWAAKSRANTTMFLQVKDSELQRYVNATKGTVLVPGVTTVEQNKLQRTSAASNRFKR